MEFSADAVHGVDVLVIEPERETRQVLQDSLGTLRVQWVGTASEGEDLLRRKEFSLVICADELPDLPGLMLFAATRGLHPSTRSLLDRAETRMAGLGGFGGLSSSFPMRRLRLFAVSILWILLMCALLFVGLSAIYHLKSALGIDLFPKSHLQDFLPL